MYPIQIIYLSLFIQYCIHTILLVELNMPLLDRSRRLKGKALNKTKQNKKKSETLCLPGIEPGTFCVLGRCDNHYTTSTYHINAQHFVFIDNE